MDSTGANAAAPERWLTGATVFEASTLVVSARNTVPFWKMGAVAWFTSGSAGNKAADRIDNKIVE